MKLFVSVVPPTIGQEILNMGLLILPDVMVMLVAACEDKVNEHL